MKLTKEDYMKLGLERCAELLVERDNYQYFPYVPPIYVGWDDCFYGGKCTNPNKDCINCPRTRYTITSTDTTLKKDGNG